MEEIWKDVLDYEGLYQVSNFGRVKSNWKILSPADNGNGYKHIVLTKNGIQTDKLVHRLVAEAFLPNPDNLPCVNHKDENKSNNFIENLEWCSHKYNLYYGNALKKMTKQVRKKCGKKIYKCSLDGTPIMGYKSVRDAAYENNLKPTNICNALKGRTKTAGGFIWCYVA